MRNLFVLMFLLGGQLALADVKVVSERSVVLPVDVSLAKVRKTNAGYGQMYLVKILVPELASETLMNHRNEGEGAPCLATYDVSTVEELIQGKPGVERVPFQITLTKSVQLREDGSCAVSLQEDISASVRGFNFFHTRIAPLPDRVAADCQ